MLVDEGKISLDDPIDKYLPEFKGLMYVAEKTDEQKVLKKVPSMPTVRHVLSHTSGMPFKSALEEPTLDLYPLHTRVKSYAMTPARFCPDNEVPVQQRGHQHRRTDH